MQELKGKILLKAKKIGGLEECVDESLADEVSDDEDVANGETESSENPPADCVSQKVNTTIIGRAWEMSDFRSTVFLVCETLGDRNLTKWIKAEVTGLDYKQRQETGVQTSGHQIQDKLVWRRY